MLLHESPLSLVVLLLFLVEVLLWDDFAFLSNVSVISFLQIALTVMCRQDRHSNLGRIGSIAVDVSLLWDNENVKPAGNDEAHCNRKHDNMSNSKRKDVKRILLLFVKCWVGKGSHNGENRGRHITETDAPDVGDPPVVACRNRNVQISLELVQL